MSTGVVPSKKVSEGPMHGCGIGIWLTTITEMAAVSPSVFDLPPQAATTHTAIPASSAGSAAAGRSLATARRRPLLVESEVASRMVLRLLLLGPRRAAEATQESRRVSISGRPLLHPPEQV